MIAFLFVSCNHLKSGSVTRKWHEDRRVYIIMQPCGKMMIPITHVDDEDWVVEIQGFYNGKQITEQYCVSEKRFNQIRQYQNFCVDGNCGEYTE